MKLAEYSDEDLIEEIRHRGIKIEVHVHFFDSKSVMQVLIGGVAFDIK